MLVSYRWLQRHVDLSDLDAERLAEDLTLHTAEVEGVERFAGVLDRVVVGRVVRCNPHPEADTLRVCRLEVGSDALLPIVCGDPRVREGQRMAVALPGTHLPGARDIQTAEIRGEESRGMICALSELGIEDAEPGVWVLPEDARVGEPVARALSLEDWVLEIDNKSITHRPDLWGHRGIAAEFAAIHQRTLKPLEDALPAADGGELVSLRIESPGCSRYVAMVLDGARPLRSPDWLCWLLRAVGQAPIDQLVDLSNFVMFDLGQPNHVFEAAPLERDGIVVRNAARGERLTTLDGAQRRLDPADLVICAGEEPVALAGVMGGDTLKVGAETRRVLLEVATFDAASVRRSAARHGLRTESSARFEKGLDPTLPARAAAHFARLLRELQPDARLDRSLAVAGEGRDPGRRISLDPERVRLALGVPVPDEEIGSILTRLGFSVAERDRRLVVDVPAARAVKDITIEQDLIEEVGRIHGYQNIPARTLHAEIVPPASNPRSRLARRIQDRLSGAARFREVISHSFVSDSLLRTLGLEGAPHVRVVNPVDQSVSAVRRSVLPSLLGILASGRRRREELRLFEIGKGYLPEHANDRGEPAEVHLLALACARLSTRRPRGFRESRFEGLYGILADLIESLELEPPLWGRPDPVPGWAHPVRCLAASWPGQGEPAAVFADLEPELAHVLGLHGDLASDVTVAEMSLDHLLRATRRPRRFRPIHRYPGIKLDIAVEVAASTQAAEIAAAIESAGGDQIESVVLFDVYAGAPLPPDSKSLAYHIVLRSEVSTLSDRDQAEFLRRLEAEFESTSARLRKKS